MNQTPTIPELIAETISGLDTVLTASRKLQRRIRAAPNCRPFEPHGITHFHQTPELFLQVAGSGHLELADTTAPLLPDHLLVVPRGVAHNEYADAGPYRNIVIGLHANRVHFHVNIGDIPGLKPGQHRIRTSHVMADKRAARVISYFNDATNDSDLTHAQALQQGLLLAATALLRDIISTPENEAEFDPFIEQIRSLVRTRLTNPDLGASHLAFSLGCNGDYLSHRFSTATGKTLTYSINEQRWELAMSLLRNPKYDISAVARSCGFNDPAYFSRVFKRHIGQSPRNWRGSVRAV